MEALSLLKYWRTSAGVVSGATTGKPRAATKTIVTAPAAVSPYSSDCEDGPYFDLEFALRDDNDSDNEEVEAENGHEEEDDKEKPSKKESESQSDSNSESSEEEDDDEVEDLKLTVESNECMENQNVAISPLDELFFKGNLVSIDDSEETHKLPVSFLKSATKFRVLLLKLKKPKSGNGDLEKSEKIEVNDCTKAPISKIQEKQGNQSGKFFTVKLKIEEVKAPLVSYFSRDNSSKDSDSNAASDEKKLTKEVQKYLKMVKPLYVRVSKRYVEKLKFPGNLGFLGGDSKSGRADAPSCAAVEKGDVVASCVKANLKQGNNNLQAGLKVMRKHLGKSRSASATVAPPPPPPPSGKMSSDRRDDSLLQVQDGIQGAILHCKKSFNGSRDGESSSSSSSMFCRSVSDPSYEKSVMMAKVSSASTSS